MSLSLSKIWVWDPGSGIKHILDPGSRGLKAPDPGSGSATLIFEILQYTVAGSGRVLVGFFLFVI